MGHKSFSNRFIFIEICCGADSALGRIENMADGVLHIRVTQKHAYAQTKTVNMIIECVRGPNCHLWYSSPCTAGCWFNALGGPNWNRGEKAREKIREHWKLHDLMWVGWERLAEHAARCRASMSIEWAMDNRIHRKPETKAFAQTYGMEKYRVSGCQFGLVSIVNKSMGRPLCKA